MTRFTGHDLALLWAYTGGSVWLEADFRSWDVKEDVSDANATAGNDTYADHLPTYADASADLQMVGTTNSGTLHWTQLAPRTQGTVYWYPEGTAANLPKSYAPAYIKSRNRSYPYADVVTVAVTYQFQGAVTDTVVS